MPAGHEIGFIGMDGAGKSTVAHALAARLEASGRQTLVTSRFTFLRAEPEGFAGDLLRGMHAAASRTLYGFAASAVHGRLDDRLPQRDQDFLSEEFKAFITGAGITANSLPALYSTILCDLAAQVAFHEAVVRPALADGTVVILETHGIKSVLKGLVLLEAAGGAETRQFAGEVFDLAVRLLGCTPASSLGICLVAEATQAYTWRSRQRGIGGLEHFGAVGGGRDEESFTSFQNRSAVLLDEVVERWEGIRLPIGQDERDVEVARNVECIMTRLADRERAAGAPPAAR